MKIGTRLTTLVCVLLAALLLVGALGIRSMSSTVENLRRMYEHHTVIANIAADIRFRRVSNVAEILRAFQHNPAQELAKLHDHPVSEHLGRSETNGAEIREFLGKLDGMAEAGDERRLIAELTDRVKKYQQEVLQPVLVAVKANEYSPAMVGQFLKQNRTLGKELDDAIAAVLTFERAAAKTAYEESVARGASMQTVTLSVIVLACLLGGWLAFAVVRSIVRPLAALRDALGNVAQQSDFSRRVAVDGTDEIGEAVQAFNALIETQQKAIGEVNGVVGAVAAGDFSRRVEADLKGDLQTMKSAVNASARSVKVTMDGLAEVMRALQGGDFSQRMSAEVKGDIKLAVDQAMQSMQTMLGDVGNVMNSVAQGNLSQRVRAEGHGDLARLKENINASVEGLSLVMKAVRQNTQQVASASNETSNAIGQISDGAQNQMHAINQVSSAVQQTAAAVTEVAKSAESANARAQGMGKAVNEGIADMNRMVEIVQSIATNADRIDKITDVIEKIANKTNLLSLNAAIEAARAGEHGKGFAVVAEEVGKLAASAAESTQEIAALVKQAVEDADRATGTVAVVNKGMQEISNGARQTEAELQRISAAMEQQNAAITEINANVGSLNRIASANASAAEEITSTVIELARLADGTRREVEKFST